MEDETLFPRATPPLGARGGNSGAGAGSEEEGGGNCGAESAALLFLPGDRHYTRALTLTFTLTLSP